MQTSNDNQTYTDTVNAFFRNALYGPIFKFPSQVDLILWPQREKRKNPGFEPCDELGNCLVMAMLWPFYAAYYLLIVLPIKIACFAISVCSAAAIVVPLHILGCIAAGIADFATKPSDATEISPKNRI